MSRNNQLLENINMENLERLQNNLEALQPIPISFFLQDENVWKKVWGAEQSLSNMEASYLLNDDIGSFNRQVADGRQYAAVPVYVEDVPAGGWIVGPVLKENGEEVANQKRLSKILASAGSIIARLVKSKGGNLKISGDSSLGNYQENRSVFEAESLDPLLSTSLVGSVRRGMKEFEIHYQPIIAAKNEKWIGIEALCRWNSPELGSVPPSVFILAAEQLGLIDTIGCWVLKNAVLQCKKWGLDKIDGFVLDVNVSALQLIDGHFSRKVEDILSEMFFPGDHLFLEITESAQLWISEEMKKEFGRLYSLGVNLAIDDFGTGYASLDSLKKIPAKRIKTDRMFIKELNKDRYSQKLIEAIVDLVHTCDMELVVEGVETSEQRDALRLLDVDYFQGYFYSRPLTAEDMEEKLQNFY